MTERAAAKIVANIPADLTETREVFEWIMQTQARQYGNAAASLAFQMYREQRAA